MLTMKPDTRRDYNERILRVLVHIQRNLGESLQLEELAGIAFFSPFHFHRVFRGMVGESVKQHVRRLRLERAAVELKSTKRTVTDIAFDAGYQAHEAFTRAFRGAFSHSPTEYRASSSFDTRIENPSDVHFVPGSGAVPFTPLRSQGKAMQVELRTLPKTRIAFVRHVGPYDEVSATWETLTDWAGLNGLFDGETQFFGACFDDPEVTSPERLRYDACITVGGDCEADGEIGIQVLRGGRYAVTLHEGAYSRLGETYAALFGRWFATQSYEPGPAPCFEFYLNDPDSTEPDDLLTEVWVPVV